MKNIINFSKRVAKYLLVILLFTIAPMTPAFAEESAPFGLTMSPMDEKIVLNPGEKYTGSFHISTASGQTDPIDYKIYVQNFYRDENGKTIFEEIDNTGKIADWITLNVDATGTLDVDTSKNVFFTIDVPEDAPAGGQYVAITVSSVPKDVNVKNGSAVISQSVGMAYLIYAEITGNTIHQGEIIDISLPSFLLDGNIKGSATIKNTGNVHGIAKYTLQVFPLFSNEEIYTNEEEPATKTILPNRVLSSNLIWEETPAVGIFNVVYTVEFEGVTTQISKLIIKCPLWLLFIIIFAIIAIIIWLVVRIRMRKKTAEQ